MAWAEFQRDFGGNGIAGEVERDGGREVGGGHAGHQRGDADCGE